MSPCNPFTRFGVQYAAVGVGFLFACIITQAAYAGRPQEQQSSQGQQQSSQQQQDPPPPPQPAPQAADPSAPKPKKVWTNDEVITLRSPADIYQAEKEAQEAADAKAAIKKAELTKQVKEAGLTMALPSTPEETERQIKIKEERITSFQDTIDRLNKDLPNVPEDQQAGIQKQVDLFTGNLQKARLELRVLQDHLQELPKTPASAPPPTPAATPPAATVPPSPGNPQ